MIPARRQVNVLVYLTVYGSIPNSVFNLSLLNMITSLICGFVLQLAIPLFLKLSFVHVRVAVCLFVLHLLIYIFCLPETHSYNTFNDVYTDFSIEMSVPVQPNKHTYLYQLYLKYYFQCMLFLFYVWISDKKRYKIEYYVICFCLFLYN